MPHKIESLEKVKKSGRSIFADILNVPMADKPRILDRYCDLFDLIRFSSQSNVMESDSSLIIGDRDVGEFSDWRTVIINKLYSHLESKNFLKEKSEDYVNTFRKYLERPKL